VPSQLFHVKEGATALAADTMTRAVRRAATRMPRGFRRAFARAIVYSSPSRWEDGLAKPRPRRAPKLLGELVSSRIRIELIRRARHGMAEARDDAWRDFGPIRRLVDASVLDGLTSIHR
jgi:hypothetical protein